MQLNNIENIIKATGPGAFGRVEYSEEGGILLRSTGIKTTEIAGSVRIYTHPNTREQLISGRRFEPIGGVWRLRPGAAYVIHTAIDFIDPIPEGFEANVELISEVYGLFILSHRTFFSGFTGEVSYVVMPVRKIEMDSMTALARLVISRSGCSCASELPTMENIEEQGNDSGTKQGTEEQPVFEEAAPVLETDAMSAPLFEISPDADSSPEYAIEDIKDAEEEVAEEVAEEVEVDEDRVFDDQNDASESR